MVAKTVTKAQSQYHDMPPWELWRLVPYLGQVVLKRGRRIGLVSDRPDPWGSHGNIEYYYITM
jgi:hypothetical protein